MRLSAAITTYNRFVQTHELFKSIAYMSEISEVVISDDCSTDNTFDNFKPFLHFEKLKLFRNDQNLGALANKIKAVERCSSDWVALLDSDNKFPRIYFQAAIEAIESLENKNMIYCPVKANPFDYSKWCGKIIDADFVRKNWSPEMECLLNTCNYVVNKKEFLKLPIDLSTNYKSYESMYFAIEWLLDGNLLCIVPLMEYDHNTSSPDGVWRKYANESESIKQQLISRIC